MDQNPESSQNQPLFEAEMRRIESETAKNEAERRKLTAEAEEVEKRLRKKWYVNELFVKWVLGGVVAAGLVVAWWIIYLHPILNVKQELAKLENMRLAEENVSEKQKNEQQRQENEKQKKINEEQHQENDRITKGMSELKVRFDSLSKETKLTAQERSKLLVQANALNEDIAQLRLKTIYFDSTSFELRPDAKTSLDENFRTLQEFPDIMIRIEGYGDGIKWGIHEEHLFQLGKLNQQPFIVRDSLLGEKRARKAMEYLIVQGISANRISIISHLVGPVSTSRRCKFIVVKQ